MRHRIPGALRAAILSLGLSASSLATIPCSTQASGQAAESGPQARYREERPEAGSGRRGLISVPRWALIGAAGCVALLGLLGLARMRRQDHGR